MTSGYVLGPDDQILMRSMVFDIGDKPVLIGNITLPLTISLRLSEAEYEVPHTPSRISHAWPCSA